MSKNKSKKKNKKHALWIALHEYSYAEFSSAIELIQAAKRCEDIKIANDYIRHSLDEYRHTRLMRSVISKYNQFNTDCYRDVRFCPNQVIKKGYVDPSIFLSQKYDFQRFSIFVGINERRASTVFKQFRKRCYKILKKHNDETEVEISYHRNVKFASETIGEIISDENKHENYSLDYAKRDFKISRFKIFVLWEEIFYRLRHFYASNNQINTSVASVVYFIVITLIIPLRFVFRVNSSDMNNLISKYNSEFML